jgi:hypothetical protein
MTLQYKHKKNIYIVGEIKKCIVLAPKQEGKIHQMLAFLPVSKARLHA